MPRTDQTPDHAHRDQPGNDIAGDFMRLLPFIAGEKGEGEEADERPVENPDQRVPHPDGRRRLDVAGFHRGFSTPHQSLPETLSTSPVPG